MTTDADLTGATVPEAMPPRYTMKFSRWAGITAHVVNEDSPQHPPADVGDVYLYFPTWQALRMLVTESLGALLDLNVIPYDVAARITRRFDEKYPEGM